MDLAGRQMWGGTVSITVNSTAETDLVKDQKTAFIFNCHNSLDKGCLTCRVFLFFSFLTHSKPMSLHSSVKFAVGAAFFGKCHFKKKAAFTTMLLNLCQQMCLWCQSLSFFYGCNQKVLRNINSSVMRKLGFQCKYLYRWTYVQMAHFESTVCFTKMFTVVHWNNSDQTLRESFSRSLLEKKVFFFFFFLFSFFTIGVFFLFNSPNEFQKWPWRCLYERQRNRACSQSSCLLVPLVASVEY